MTSTDVNFYGQTSVSGQGHIDNPTTNDNGVVGASALPYTVPAGSDFELDDMGIEGYKSTIGDAVIFLWFGPTNLGLQSDGPSISAGNSFKESSGWKVKLPAGTIINARLTNAQQAAGSSQVYGWYVRGRLVPAPVTIP
jgi:hypothetical protein